MQAVVLAAGKGVRLKPLTDKIPKAMVKIGSKPLLEIILENLQKAGIKEILLVVGYKKEVIENYFKKEFNGMKITYFVQERQLGTANAIGIVQEKAQESFLVVNGDVIVDATTLKEIAQVDEFETFDALLLAREVKDPWRYGCLLVQGEKIIGIIEKPSPGKEPSNLVNAGVYRFNQTIFDAIKKTPQSVRGEFEIIDSIKILIEKGKSVVYKKISGKVLDIGNTADLEKANRQTTKD